ncbi:MAG TPA: potassium channel family protein [Thermoanaerobaculia bacterium]|nr:potassium channel family protein [Thermoanaerobaculia bacterium]
MDANAMSSPTVGQGSKRPDVHLEIFIWGIAALLTLAFAVACHYYAGDFHDREWIYVTAILGLPLLQVPIVILMLRKNSDLWGKGALVLLPALLVEVLLWLAFTFRDLCKGVLPLASVVGLGFALVLGAVVFWVTSLVMGFADGRGVQFRELLRDQPFLVVCFFLTIFTFVALFLSLSLALHDQDLRINKERFGLYSRDFEPFRPGMQADGLMPVKVLFSRGSAAVEVGTPDDSSERTGKEVNEDNLNRLTEEIASLAEKDHVRVVLVGHSVEGLDKTNPSKPPLELSQARIDQVIVSLLKRLYHQSKQEWRRNIDWLILPCSNSPGFLGDRGEHQSVEVLVLPLNKDGSDKSFQSGKNLHLLDYIYYGVYTITTTGSGDIVPVSAYAKFVTTIANFFAIFLLAVFFNVLLSFLREGGDRPKGPEPAGG